jgi:hypothetical protein
MTTAAASQRRTFERPKARSSVRGDRGSVPSFVYVLMATLFVVTALASFVPTSFALVSRVYSGEQPLPPFVVHFHAASMSLWLLLLLTQSLLAHTHRPRVHRKLGLISLVLAPCILISMYGMDLWGVATFNVQDTVVTSAIAPADRTAQLHRYAASILLIHGASYLLFPTFYLWAILVRRKDNESHKRLMILATLVLMIPGLGRLLSITHVLPDLGLGLIDARHFYLLVLIAPALIYEVLTRRVLHRSYSIGVGLLGAWIVAAHFLWSVPWWIANAPRLLGVA